MHIANEKGKTNGNSTERENENSRPLDTAGIGGPREGSLAGCTLDAESGEECSPAGSIGVRRELGRDPTWQRNSNSDAESSDADTEGEQKLCV